MVIETGTFDPAVLSVASYPTPNGKLVTLATRPDTADEALTWGILGDDEYHLRGRSFSGAMLDIGGYIGMIGLTLAIENPDLRVLIVEAVEDNVAMIRRNISLNGLGERVEVLYAAAGATEPTEIRSNYRSAGNEPAGYVHDSRYVGNIYTSPDWSIDSDVCVVDGIDLAGLVKRLGHVDLMKVDCEGCEWKLLAGGSDIPVIFGEWHGDPGLKGLRKLLPKHKVVQVDENPVNGIFWATHK